MAIERSPDDIQRRMEILRGSLDSDVQRVASSVRTKTDWRYYVRKYPWWTVAGAAAVGFLFVPRRRVEIKTYIPDPDALAALAKKEKLVVAPPKAKRSGENGIASRLASIALAVGTRAAIGYAQGVVSRAASKQRSTDTNQDAPANNAPSDERATQSAGARQNLN